MSAPRAPGWPAWAREVVELYESGATNQFVLYGNVGDRLLVETDLPDGRGDGARLGSLPELLAEHLLAGFDVLLTYDVGNGIRVLRGGEAISRWPPWDKAGGELPKTPRPAIETLTRYFRYVANLAVLGRGRGGRGKNLQVAAIVDDAHLVAPAAPGGAGGYELAAVASLLRDWASEPLLAGHTLATFLVTENLADLHPLVTGHPRTARVKVPLPGPEEIAGTLRLLAGRCPTALRGFALSDSLDQVGHALAGSSLSAVESMVLRAEHRREAIQPEQIGEIKKAMVEADADGLVELVRSARTLDDFAGNEPVKRWLRQDLALWRRGEIRALPKGYLVCGPVGTGKTFLAGCLAGEAGVPVVKIKNFRERWVGTTEGNLEKIFRLLQALGRVIVFVDEADQTLGRRGADGDSGLSGRVYSMIAQEMGRSDTRGRVIWILASSRPDLLEVDLKRPGRLDVRVPLYPTASAEEGFELLAALARRWSMDLSGDEARERLLPLVPDLLTPAAAEALAFKAYREVHASEAASESGTVTVEEAYGQVLVQYRPSVPLEILELQIRLATEEATDGTLVPERFRL